jgi:hypothetical protein
MNDVYAVLIPYFASLSGVTCIRPQQNVPAPQAPYCTVDIQSIQPQGAFRESVADDGTVTMQRNFNFTVDLNVYGKENSPNEAETIAHNILDGLEDHARRVLAMNGNVAFQQVLSPVTDVTALIGKQYQPRYNIAMRWNTSKRFTFNNGVIDVVEIEDMLYNDLSIDGGLQDEFNNFVLNDDNTFVLTN